MASEAESQAPTVAETWHGSCHCGAQAFTVNLEQPLYDQEVSSCNCMSYASRFQFILLSHSLPAYVPNPPPTPHRPPVHQLTNPGSICHLNGYLFIYPPNKNITWTSGGPSQVSPSEASTTPPLTRYTFNQGRIAHSFCSTCGTSICGASARPDFFPDHTALNVSSFPSFPFTPFFLSSSLYISCAILY
jgi:hypothetical protein